MTDHDRWLDRDLDDYYSDAEDDIVENDDWMIDKYIEDQIRSEDWFDEHES